MIAVETLPVRMVAVQWHEPGDCADLVKPYQHGQETRYGVHEAHGMQRVTPGCWIVLSNGAARVYGREEFAHRFRIVEEEENQP